MSNDYRNKVFSIIIIIAIVLICYFSIKILIESEEPAPAIAKWLNPKIDLGIASEGDQLEAIFEFENVGGQTLRVKDVTFSCGCMTQELSSQELLPGQRGQLVIHFNTSGLLGNMRKQVHIETDDQRHPKKRLLLSVNIRELISVRPRILDFGEIIKGEKKKLEFNIDNTDGTARQLQGLTVETANNYAFLEKSIQDKREMLFVQKYIVEIDTSEKECGFFKDTLFIRAVHAGKPWEKSVLIKGVISSEIRANPEVVVLGVIKPGDLCAKTVYLTHVYGSKFTIEDVKTNIEGLGIEFDSWAEADRQRLNLSYSSSSDFNECNQNICGNIQIKTSLGEAADSNIPVYLMVRRH